MKRNQKLLLLCGILIAVCLLTVGVMQIQEHRENIQASGDTILSLSADSVQQLSWEGEDGSFAFHRGDDGWVYDSDEAFPVDDEEMNQLLSLFENFGASFVIADVDDYAQYGLDDPTGTITLTTADATYEIQSGDYSTMDAQRYVSIGDGNVYLVTNDPVEWYHVTLAELIHGDSPLSYDTVSSLQFNGEEDTYTATCKEDGGDSYCAEDVYFTRRDGTDRPLDSDNVALYLNTLSSLALQDYVTYTATDDDLSVYGLDDPELTVTVTYQADDAEDSSTYTLALSRDPAERQAGETADTDEEVTAYVRVGNSSIIYQITTSEYQALMQYTYNDLRHQELFTADFSKVSRITATLDGSTYTITVKKPQSDSRAYYYQDEVVDISSFQGALEGLYATSFSTQQATGQNEITLTFSFVDEEMPELTVALYRYDGSSCLAVVNDQTTALVSRSSAVDITEAIRTIVLNEN